MIENSSESYLYVMSQCFGQYENMVKNKKHKLESLLKIQQIGI